MIPYGKEYLWPIIKAELSILLVVFVFYLVVIIN